ncbi:MAG: 2OG-Fe(II) oxygenase [Saccharospirillum sp.]
MQTDIALDPLSQLDDLAHQLRQQGWAHLPQGLPEALALDLLQDLHGLDEAQWHLANIGRQQDQHRNELVRRDAISWLTGATPAQRAYLALTEQWRLELNRRLILGLFDYECHYARYDAGAFYRKHLDAFRGRSNRILTMVAYLNPAWPAQAGGELVLYSEDDVEIGRFSPTLGSVLVFLSEDFPHEVLAADRARFSITGWFRHNNSIQGVVDPSR